MKALTRNPLPGDLVAGSYDGVDFVGRVTALYASSTFILAVANTKVIVPAGFELELLERCAGSELHHEAHCITIAEAA